eukprot:CAMPEP_0176102134 /NCGR_PEP_ID=MMETSP0120_2-20121206/51229_1 /TAXON_ID=160619 /ORGANISM="Kryptoperidinium foliaceum, Strain CCMP 1326" /LENGTH=50 /DNA_ID=CAMNT_0017436191 /DNA_START=145 /DNA_END=293 /DNA_ORIENTATION=-
MPRSGADVGFKLSALAAEAPTSGKRKANREHPRPGGAADACAAGTDCEST